MRAERGNVTVAFVFVIPTILAFLVLCVNVAMSLHVRTKLQIAADRGVFAGAASLAHSLNEIAMHNWEIHREFKELEAWLGETTEPSEDEVKRRFTEARSRQADLLEDIRGINASMFAKALIHARSIVAANVSAAEFVPFFEPPEQGMMRIGVGEGEGGQYGSLTGADVVGPLFEPESYDIEEPEKMLRYVEKRAKTDVVFGGTAIAHMPVPVFSSLFGGSMAMSAVAAAQPYGGSLKGFALVESGGEDAPVVEGREYLYRVGFVPVRLVEGADPTALH